jgi:hypothetical protein
LILDQVFVDSLRLRKGVNESTRDLIERLAGRKGKPVGAKHVARELGIPIDRAEKRNRKLYVAVPPPHFVPDPERLFCKLHLKDTVRIFHPITGEKIVYRPKR